MRELNARKNRRKGGHILPSQQNTAWQMTPIIIILIQFCSGKQQKRKTIKQDMVALHE